MQNAQLPMKNVRGVHERLGVVAGSMLIRSGSFLASFEAGAEVIAVHLRDEVEGDLLWADRFALSVVGTAAEHLFHDLYHLLHALPALRLALGKKREVRDLRRGE